MPALPANFLDILKSKLETDFVPLLPELLNKERPKADQDKKQLSRAFSGFVLHKMLNLGIADAAQSVVDDFDDNGLDGQLPGLRRRGAFPGHPARSEQCEQREVQQHGAGIRPEIASPWLALPMFRHTLTMGSH